MAACGSPASEAEGTAAASAPATEEAKAPAKTVAQRAEGVAIGEPAPNFNLKGTDGNSYSLDNIMDGNGEKPKGYIVIFTCNTCPYAVASEQRIIDLHNKYAPQGYPVVAIQPNDPAAQPGDSFEAMQERAKEMGYPFLYLFDEGQKVYPAYGATRTPEVFLLDADKYVKYHGAIDDSVRDAEAVEEKFLENAIEALQNGQTPAPVETKAVGCSIKTV
ncbi:thioredoxin family protein [Phaeodactylibacter luteus]|uniref:Thioredoxin family protein n=2 Tax=Phaeodactylibacter luteus TaxID=1564516 RepID=A0A5C6RQG8_9BACT|nr:thioredoxin family protein [Phaeodactylibacter luteus]